MSGIVLPVDSDAEESLISAILTSPEAFLEISEKLRPEDFGTAAPGAIYTAALSVDQAGKPIDHITIADELRKTKTLARAGGADNITRLAQLGTDVCNISAHIDIVADKALLRRLAVAGRNIATDALNPEMPAPLALESAEKHVFDIAQGKNASSLKTMSQAVPEALGDLARARTSVLIGHPTGLDQLDRLTGGLQAGQLVTLAARPGIGKSALAAQIARNIAQQTGNTVALLSYEMSTSEITLRMLANALRYDLHKLRQGDMPAGMENDLANVAQDLANVPLMIDDNPPETITGVRSAMRRLAARGQLGAIVIDYLQLMSGERRGRDENRTQEVSEISRGLKRLATELGVPVLALSQLNRALEQRPNKRPMLADLRDSGSIEQDSSVVLFLHREHVFNAAADPNMAELIIAKQRNGPMGTIHLRFDGPATRFSEPASFPGTHTNGYTATSSPGRDPVNPF